MSFRRGMVGTGFLSMDNYKLINKINPLRFYFTQSSLRLGRKYRIMTFKVCIKIMGNQNVRLDYD